MLSICHAHLFWRFGSVLALMFCCILPKARAQQGILFKVNPQPDHYYLAPSGLRAEMGERTIQNTSLAFFQYNRMKSKGRSVGWGFVPTFLLRRSVSQIVRLAPHSDIYTSRTKRSSISVRSAFLRVSGTDTCSK